MIFPANSSVGQAYLGLDIHFVTPRVGMTYVFLQSPEKKSREERLLPPTGRC